MKFHTLDYRKDRDGRGLVNRGFWLFQTPRLMPLCRLRGHRPVVDGVDFTYVRPSEPRRSRWACCDRCGIRLLQPVDSDLEIGQPYTDPLPGELGARGQVGGQLVLGGAHAGLSAQVALGARGDEHTLSAHLHLGRLAALYLHTEHHGTWLQRRLNPTGYNTRVIGTSLHDGLLSWAVWAKQGESHRDDPWWRQRTVRVDPRDQLLGPRRYSYTDIGEPVTATVRMAAGDDHEVTLQLQRQSLGRTRTRRRELAWIADWECLPGIPTRPDGRGRVSGSGVPLAAATRPDRQHWVQEACAAIAADLTRDRAKYGYRPPAEHLAS